MTVILATVIRGAATATPLGACLPLSAVAVIATVVPLSVSAWAARTMPSLGTACASLVGASFRLPWCLSGLVV